MEPNTGEWRQSFDTRLDLDIERLLEEFSDTEDTQDPGDIIHCVSCMNRITGTACRTEVNGRHAHHCTNPMAISFHIGCFSTAWGCKPQGPSTGEHSWFAGYDWRIVNCSSCDVHLGWRFASAGDSFYGLILKRLVVIRDDPHH